MNVLNLFTKTYARLHNYSCIPYWVMTPFRRMVRGAANVILPHYLAKSHPKKRISGKGIIISFTSFPARINEVWQVVESLKNQTVRPEKIILWLSKVQFANIEDVPLSLRKCEDALFEIRMVDGDIRSHKKYYYAMQEFPDKTIVTCDDDIYYHKEMLQTLIEASQKYPGCVIANRSKMLVFGEDGEIVPYLKWDDTFKPFASKNRVQIGVGGVLYPPHCLHELTLRNDLFTKLAPLADDLWLNLMARLKKTPVVQSGKNILPLPVKTNSPSLSSVNTGAENANDKQLCNMREWLAKEGFDDVYLSNYQ